MSQPYNTGGVFVFVGLGSGNSPLFLGTGLRAPKQQIQRFYSPIYNDIAGEAVEYDNIYQGQRGAVTVELTKWRQATLDILQSIPLPPGGAANPGIDILGDVGTMMLTENFTFPLWILYDYGASGRGPKAAQIGAPSGGLPPGRRWRAAILDGPDDETVGTGANSIMLSWRCGRAYDPGTGAFACWDRNMSGVNTGLIT